MNFRSFLITAIVAVFLTTGLYSQNKRMVLVEEATNASCPPCASQNPAFKAFLLDNINDVIPLIYRSSWPGRDDMHAKNTVDNNARVSYYNVTGVPSGTVNGGPLVSPGTRTAMDNELNKYKKTTTPIKIDVSHSIAGNNLIGSVTVSSSQAISNKMLRIAIVEAYHYYENAGTNGEKEFYFIHRKMFPNASGTVVNIAANGSQTVDVNWALDAEFHKENMYIVAFLQDDTSKEVLQAAASMTFLKGNLAVSGSKYVKGAPGSQVTLNVQINNTYQSAYNYKLEYESSIPDDWSITGSGLVTVNPNSTQTVPVTVNIGNTPFYAPINISASIEATAGTFGLPANISMGVMSNSVKNLMFYGTTASIMLPVNALFNNPNYGANSALVPLDPALLQAYPAKDFNTIIFMSDFDNRGSLSHMNAPLSGIIYSYMNEILQAGGNVLMMSELELYFGSTPGQYHQAAYNFFNNTIGITKAGNPDEKRSKVEGNQIILYQFDFKGVDGDEIGNLLNYRMNIYNQQSNPYYIRYTDNIALTNGSSATVFMKDEDGVNLAVRNVVGNGKFVFSGVGFSAFSNQADRNDFFNRIVTWFEGSVVEPDKPEISVSATSLDFGSSETAVSRQITVKNPGKAALNVSAVTISDDADGVFSILAGEGPFTVDPGGTHSRTIEVQFAPKATGNYTAKLRIASNDEDNAVMEVSLTGSGTVSVRDGIATVADVMTVTITPNPVTANAQINYELSGLESQNAELYIIDASGKKVAGINSGSIVPGTYTHSIDANDFNSGSYFIITNVNGKSVSLPFAIVK